MDRQLFPVSIFMILYLFSCSGPSAEQTWRKFKCKSFCCWRITNLGISITSIRYRSSPVWGYCICLLWLVNDIKQNRCRMKNTIRRRRIETERSERERATNGRLNWGREIQNSNRLQNLVGVGDESKLPNYLFGLGPLEVPPSQLLPFAGLPVRAKLSGPPSLPANPFPVSRIA